MTIPHIKLADRLVGGEGVFPDNESGRWMEKMSEGIKDLIRTRAAPVIVADNIVKYFNREIEINPKQKIDFSEYPMAAPPLKRFFWEGGRCPAVWVDPPHRYGILCDVIDLENKGEHCCTMEAFPGMFDAEHTSGARWVIVHILFAKVQGERGSAVVAEPVVRALYVTPGGTVTDRKVIFGLPEDVEFANNDSTAFAAPMIMTFSFMNCSNIEYIEHAPVINPVVTTYQKKRKTRVVRYHTLVIEKPGTKEERRRGGTQSGIKKALHMCRGHFATYTEDRPLFGHFVGTVWKPQHVRGAQSKGIVVKDYACVKRGTHDNHRTH